MWGLPSGNHLIWIRPHFQQVAEKYREAGQKAREHKISVLEAAVEATRWGDENAPVDVKSWFSVAYDPDQKFWVARSNPDICQGFMKARTGGAEKQSEQLWFYSPGIRVEGPALALLHYQYGSEATAKLAGNAMRGMTFDSEGGQKDWAGRTRFVRQLDMSAMTPQERLCEMMEAAVRDKHFASEMKAQFGVLGDPTFLLTMGAVFGVFIGVGAGAYVLGGAAFAAAVSKLLGIAMIGMQVKSYVDLFSELQRCCFSQDQKDFVKGSKCIQDILCAAVRDIALLVTMEGALKIGAKAAGLLKTLFLRYAPMKWIEAAKAGRAEAEALLARVKCRKYGYAGEHLMKLVNESQYFRRGEGATYRQRSIRNGEMVALREVSTSRKGVLDALNGWARGKPEWAKLKSWHGKWGIAGFRNTSEAAAIVRAQPKSDYPMGMLKGINPELDAFIAKHEFVKAYEVPYDQEVLLNFERDPSKPVKMKSGFDWTASGKKNHALAKGFKLIDLGDHFLLVDPLGNPVIQDVDIASIYKTRATYSGGKGTHSGSHSQRLDKPGNIEDDFVIEEMENYHLFESNGEIYDPNKHGGAAGSTGHGENNLSHGKKGWTPLHDDGSFDKEKILVFLPYRSLIGDVTHAGLKCDLFEFAGWKEYLQFCEANNIRMPWLSSGRNNAPLPLHH